MKKLLAILIAAFSMFCANALDASVVSVKGKVEVQEAGTWVALTKGDVIEKGSVISTGFNSEVVIAVKSSTFTLGPLTRATIENLVAKRDRDNTQLYIDSGSVTASVSGDNGRRASFKVRSPVATASVRGTSFSVSSSGKLSVSEGLVAFGSAESESPVVDTESVDEPEAESASSDPGHGNALTSTSDVGGEGVPVAAGQKSVANTVSSTPSSPMAEFAKVSSGSAGNAAITVSAGQRSIMNPVSNTPSSPFSSFSSSASLDTVKPLSSQNGVSSGNSEIATPGDDDTPVTGAIAVDVKPTGSISVSVEFE